MENVLLVAGYTAAIVEFLKRIPQIPVDKGNAKKTVGLAVAIIILASAYTQGLLTVENAANLAIDFGVVTSFAYGIYEFVQGVLKEAKAVVEKVRK